MSTFAISPEEFLVRQNAEEMGVDPDLAARVAHTESAFDPSAISPKGARGVMQLMPDTAKEMGVDPNDSSENIRGGVTYFKQLLDRYGGDEKKAAAAYNAGPARVDSGKPLPKETQDYVAKVVPDASPFTVSPEDFLKQQSTPGSAESSPFSVSPEDFLKQEGPPSGISQPNVVPGTTSPASAPAPPTSGGQQVIPGMEQLGGQPPGMPGAPVPAGMQNQTPAPTPTVTPPSPAPATKQQPLYMAPGPADGLITPGTIDLTKLPVANLGNGMWGTVRSASREVNGKEVLYPTIVNGKPLSDDQAFAYAMKTGQNLGVFNNGDSADAYAERLHEDWQAGKIAGVQMPPQASAPGAIPGMQQLGGAAPGIPKPPVPAGLSTPTPGRQAVFTADNPPPTAGAFGQEKGFAPSRAQAEQFADPEFKALMREAWKGYAGEIPQGNTPAEDAALGLARAAAGVISPENLAIMLGGEGAAGFLKAATTSAQVAKLLADNPAVRKAIDLAVTGTIHSAFSGYAAFQGIQGGEQAIDAYKRRDYGAATEYGAQAATSLVFAALGVAGARQAIKETTASYPTPAESSAPLRPVEKQLAESIGIPAPPSEAQQAVAVQKAEVLTQQGQHLAAQSWKNIANWGKFSDSQGIKIGDDVYTIDRTAIPGPQGGTAYHYALKDTEGNVVVGGPPEIVQGRIQQMQAAPTASKEAGGALSVGSGAAEAAELPQQSGAISRPTPAIAGPETPGSSPFTVSPEEFLKQNPPAAETPTQQQVAQSPEIKPGAEFQIGTRKYTVQGIDEQTQRVTYSIEGSTQKPITLIKPWGVFQQIISASSPPASSASPATAPTNQAGAKPPAPASPSTSAAGIALDPRYQEMVDAVTEAGKASTSTLQRKFRIGYGAASQVLDQMEKDGIVGPADGSKPRELLAAAQAAGQPGAQPTGQQNGQQTEDIITGTLNPSLDAQGKADAERRAADTANVTQINAGPAARTQESAQPAAKAAGVPVSTKPGLQPWNLGVYQGKPQSEVDDKINYYIAHPDELVPGGTSYNAYKGPLIDELLRQRDEFRPGQRILNFTHSIGVQTVQAWIAAGAHPDRSIDLQSMLNRAKLEPTALLRIDPRTMQASMVQNTKQDGIFLERHADTPLDNIAPTSQVQQSPDSGIQQNAVHEPPTSHSAPSIEEPKSEVEPYNAQVIKGVAAKSQVGGETAAPEGESGIEPGANVVETLRYKTKANAHDKITVYVRNHPGKGWEAEGDFNLQGQAGGHLGDSGYDKFYPTREEAIREFVKSATRPQNTLTAQLGSGTPDKTKLRQRAMVEWVKQVGAKAAAGTPLAATPEPAGKPEIFEHAGAKITITPHGKEYKLAATFNGQNAMGYGGAEHTFASRGEALAAGAYWLHWQINGNAKSDVTKIPGMEKFLGPLRAMEPKRTISFERGDEEIREHIRRWDKNQYWDAPHTLANDPKIGDLYQSENGHQELVTWAARRSTTKGNDNKLDLTLMHTPHVAEPTRWAVVSADKAPQGKLIRNIYTDRGMEIPQPKTKEEKQAEAAEAPEAKPPEAKQEPNAPHKFSTTQVDLPPAIAAATRAWAAKIPAKALAEDGREPAPHVTVKYGLHDEDAAAATQALEGEGPIKVKFGAISIFKGAKPQDPDVLKIDVTSPDLRRLNAKVGELPNSDEHPKYVPHVTLAYVKRGMGDRYVGKIVPGVSGKTVTLSTVVFSAKNGQETDIPLAEKQQAAVASPTGAPAAASAAKATDKSIPHLPVQTSVQHGQVVSASLANRKAVLAIKFAAKDWPSEENAKGHGNVRYLQSQFLRDKLKKAGLDFAENFEIPGQEAAINPDRIIGSHLNAINKALGTGEAQTATVAAPHRKGSKVPTGPLKAAPVKPFTAGEPVREGDTLTITYTRPDHSDATLEANLAKELRVSKWNNDYSQRDEIDRHFEAAVAAAQPAGEAKAPVSDRKADTSAEALPWQQTLKEYRDRPEALNVPKGSVLAVNLDQETPETLQRFSKPHLQVLAKVAGTTQTGNKQEIAERILRTWQIRGGIKDATVESLAEQPGTELRKYLDELNLWKGGNKRSQATSIINWRNNIRNEGKNLVTEGTWMEKIRRAVAEGETIPDDVVKDINNRDLGWILKPEEIDSSAEERAKSLESQAAELRDTQKAQSKLLDGRSEALAKAIDALHATVTNRPGADHAQETDARELEKLLDPAREYLEKSPDATDESRKTLAGLIDTAQRQLVAHEARKPESQKAPAKPSAKAKYAAEVARRRDFYTPGNIIHVDYWNSYDKVLGYNEKPNGQWSVTVQHTNKEGVPIPGAEIRTHATEPDKNDKIIARATPAREQEPQSEPESQKAPVINPDSRYADEENPEALLQGGREQYGQWKQAEANYAELLVNPKLTQQRRHVLLDSLENARRMASATLAEIASAFGKDAADKIRAAEEPKIEAQETPNEPHTRAGENPSALEEVPSENVSGTGEEREARESPEERGRVDEGSLRPGDRTGASSGPGEGTDPGAVGVPAGRAGNAGTRPSPQSRVGSGTDYRITDADHIGEGSIREKAAGNVQAIRTLKQIEADGRIATPDEQKILAKYVGWGGIPQLFKESYYVPPEWQGMRADLDGLLTPEEFSSASASTPNAHFTSPMVIKGMWDAAKRLGLLPPDGLVTVLEPSMGVGSFFGLMPDDTGTTGQRVGVELDSITGRIAKALYPESDVHVAGFEKVRLPNDYFDLAISNVPFGNYPVFDTQYKRTPGVTRSIHNYFFAKALDKVRPGGVVAFITSSYTMDQQDPFMREYLAQRANLIGAMRLPNTTFKATAGTEVTTDVIFLQKRASDAPAAGPAWSQLKPITGERERPDGSMGPAEMQVNEYYAEHPEMMLGKIGLSSKMRGGEQNTLSGILTPEKLTEAINRLPENIVSAWQAPQESFDSVSSIPAPGELKDGGYTIQDGKVLVRVGDQLRPTDVSAEQTRRISGQIKVREAVYDVFRTQLAGDSESEISAAMKKLNTAYDAFVRNNGPLHKKENAKAFADDPDAPVLLALEDWDKETQKATKADIFSKRVIDTTKPATSADNARDALGLSLNEKGRLDWARMQELTGRTPQELQEELGPLVYQNPSGKAWEPADEYLSGNVRQKLADAEAAAEIDRKFQRNVEALKAVQPKELLPGEIKARLGSSWIPKQDVQKFVSELLDVPLRSVTVGHSEGLGSWTLSLSQKDTVANNRTWGTNRFRGSDLIDDALNLRSPTAYDASKDANGNDIRVINDKETLAAREMQKQIKDKFSEWTWSDPERAARLAQIYNEELNSDRLWQPDGSHLTFPGMNLLLKLRPHQKNGVWRIVRGDGNVLLAHVVGSGKTLEIVAGAMELRRLGKSKKPMIVVPNNRVGGTAEEWYRAYPSANILTVGGEDFIPEQRQEMMARIATGNWDGVIVSYEAFTKVPISDETFNGFLKQQIHEYEGFIRDAKQDKSDTKIVKELEKAKKRMEAKIRTKNDDVRRDRAINFEDLGVDSLFVDEADSFKNLPFSTKMQRISGIPNTESQRAFDMYLKTQYLTQRNNGRGVIFATGTPVANSMAEVWTMQRYLQPQYLKDHGLQHFDSWAQTFGEVNPALEMTPDGTGVRVTNKFNKFVNMPELIKGFRQVADVQTAKMLQLPVPKLKGGRPTIVSAKASPAQQAYLKHLAERAKEIKGKKPAKGADNILVIGTDGQKAAVDIRLVDPSQPDHPTSKVNMAVDRIADTWKKTAAKKSTQIVFLDMSTPQPKRRGQVTGGFSVYEDMRDKLIRRGIPKNEIAFIQDYKDQDAKEELFRAMQSGKVRILFGSTMAAGVGVNVQRKLIAQHQLDAPYRPRDVEQREGRILRQGNQNPEVEIIRYVTEPSFDARKWDILTGKASYINAFMEGDMTVREMEDISDAELSYGEIAAIASGNPAIREKVMVDTEIRKLDAMRSRYEQQEYAIKRDLQALPGSIKSDHIEEKKAQKDIDTRDSSPNNFTIGKKTFTGDDGRKKAGEALEALLNTRFNEKGTDFGSQTFPIGSYRGLRLVGIDFTLTDGIRHSADILIQGELSYRSLNPDPATAIQSIEGKVRNIEAVRDNWARSAAESEKKLADTKKIAGQSFDQGDKLKQLLGRQAELEKILQTKEPDASAVDGDSGEDEAEAPQDLAEIKKQNLTSSLHGSENGPIDAYKPGRGTLNPSMNRSNTGTKEGWLTSEDEGRPLYSDGHILLQGAAPGPVAPTAESAQKSMQQYLHPETAPTPVIPVAYGAPTEKGAPQTVWFSDGTTVDNETAIDAKYYDHILKQYPGATFAAGKHMGKTPALYVQFEGRTIGIVMPVNFPLGAPAAVRPFLNPVPKEEAQEEARDVADKRTEGGERGSFSQANSYQKRARLEKAIAMAEALDAAGATVAEARELTDAQWKMAAQLATALARKKDPDANEVYPPHSQATKDEAIGHLKLIHGIRANGGERGSTPLIGDLYQHLTDKFGPAAARANLSGIGSLKRIALPGKQLAEIEKASKLVFRSAIRAAGSESYAATLMRASIPAIRAALKGSDHSWEELELYYVESRLRGLRDRWNGFADQSEHMTPDEMLDAMKESPDGSGSAFLGLLSNIEGRQGLAQDLGQTALALAQDQDWDNLGKFLTQTFRDAGDRVARAMEDSEFEDTQDAVRNDPQMREADRLYGELLEEPMSESHSLNEGVFSDALGPAGRYFPLMAVGRDQKSPAGRRLAYRKPQNQNNAFATGLSESYDISMDAFAKRLSGAIRGNNKAALIEALKSSRWARPLSEAWENEEHQLVMEGPDGNEYLAVREESSAGRTLIQGRKITRLPAHFIVMPKFINRALKPILAREPMDPNSVIAAMRWANNLATKGPLELIFHMNGVLGALYANTPFLGDSLPSKVLSAPIAKWFDIRRRMYGDLVAGKLGLWNDPLNPSAPENVKKLLEMSKAGALPSRSGKVTYSKTYAEETGAKLERASFGPALYGPHGLDARARVLMYDIWKAAYPKGDVESLHHFVNQIGNYIPELQGEIEKWFKHVGLGPFATAGMTRIVNSFHTFSGTGPGPGGTWKSRLHWWLTASAAAALAVWVVAHKELTGQWPLHDKMAKLFEIPVQTGHGIIGKLRHTKFGEMRWGRNSNPGYISIGFIDNPLAMRGARAIGIRGAAETLNMGGTGGQAAEAAEADILNTLASPALGPLARAAFVGLTGEEPYLTGFRDYRTGKPGLSFMPAVPPKTKPGWPTAFEHGKAALKQLNSLGAEAAENLGALTGLYTADQELPKGAGNWWLRSVLDLAAPGLFANSSNPYGKAAALRQQQRALGIR